MVRQIRVNFTDFRYSYTRVFERHALELCRHMTIKSEFFFCYGLCNQSNIGRGLHPCRTGSFAKTDNVDGSGVQKGKESLGVHAGLSNDVREES